MIDAKSVGRSISSRNASWEAADNEISALPDAVFKSMLGATPSLGDPSDIAAASTRALSAPAVALPSTHDWRDVAGDRRVTNIRNQGPCMSCVSFAVVAAMEAAACIAKGAYEDIDLSEADLFFGCGSTCQAGMLIQDALARAQTFGVGWEKDFPYTPSNVAHRNVPAAYRIQGWHFLMSQSQRKQAICEDGPIVAQMQVFEDLRVYKAGVYEHVDGQFLGFHAVCIVGYDDGAGCWIVKNSWGERWGEQGYLRIKYGQCCIDDASPSYGLHVEAL
jgi:C1A family cysteine protease